MRRRIERTPEWEGLRIEERGWTIAGISLNPHSSILAPRCRERGGTQGGTQSFSRDGNQRDTLSALRSSSASKAGLRMEERGLRGISLDPHSSILAPFRANPRRRRRADPEDALRRRNAKSPPVESGREPTSQDVAKKTAGVLHVWQPTSKGSSPGGQRGVASAAMSECGRRPRLAKAGRSPQVQSGRQCRSTDAIPSSAVGEDFFGAPVDRG